MSALGLIYPVQLPLCPGSQSKSGGPDGASLVTVQEIAQLIRRHLLAFMIVLAVGAGFGYSVKHTPLTYAESATVVFTPPKSVAYPNPFTTLSSGLTQTAGIIAILVMSPQGQQQVRSAGGASSYDAELVNLYNLEYPNYSDPFVAVTATSTNPVSAHRTFTVVVQLLGNVLKARQEKAGVPKVDRIGWHVVGDSGVLPEQGSSKRVLAGLLILTIVAAFSVAGFLERHPVRPMRRSRLSNGLARVTQNGQALQAGQERTDRVQVAATTDSGAVQGGPPAS
jgi:hypothetical protein